MCFVTMNLELLTSTMLGVRIVHMVLVVNHWMKTMIAIRVIGEIVFSVLHKVRVTSGVDIPGEHTLNDGAEHVTAMLPDHFARVNVRRVYIDRTTRCVNLLNEKDSYLFIYFYMFIEVKTRFKYKMTKKNGSTNNYLPPSLR